jgi:hypothetical protein
MNWQVSKKCVAEICGFLKKICGQNFPPAYFSFLDLIIRKLKILSHHFFSIEK